MAAVQRIPDTSLVEIRRLGYPDLPQVIAIERRAFPTPWSLAMFVLELSKSSGICLAAILPTGRHRRLIGNVLDPARPGSSASGRLRHPLTGNAEGPGSAASGRLRHPLTGNREGPGSSASSRLRHPLCGYLICSRYDTVWHIMNIAVDTPHRRLGIATELLAALYDRVEDHSARYTLEVRQSNHQAIRLYEREGFRAAGLRRRYYQDNGEDALIMWRTPATLLGSFQDVPNPAP